MTNVPKLNKLAAQLNGKLRQIAAEENVLFIDLNEALSTNGLLKQAYSYDGLHLSAAGYIAWANVILPIINRLVR